MTVEVDELIRHLRNFRHRKEATRALIDAGDAAAEPLVGALKSERNEGAKWAMINTLGKIGNKAVVPALAEFLEEEGFREITHEALVRISGEDSGYACESWVNWFKDHVEAEKAAGSAEPHKAEAPPSSGGEPEIQQVTELPAEKLVDLALTDANASIEQKDAEDFYIDVSFANGRHQLVRVAFGKRDSEGSEIVIIYTECCPAEPKLYERILRRNMKMSYGSIAVRDVNGVPYFVVFNTLLREGLSPLPLRKSIMSLAKRADKIEKALLKGADEH